MEPSVILSKLIKAAEHIVGQSWTAATASVDRGSATTIVVLRVAIAAYPLTNVDDLEELLDSAGRHVSDILGDRYANVADLWEDGLQVAASGDGWSALLILKPDKERS